MNRRVRTRQTDIRVLATIIAGTVACSGQFAVPGITAPNQSASGKAAPKSAAPIPSSTKATSPNQTASSASTKDQAPPSAAALRDWEQANKLCRQDHYALAKPLLLKLARSKYATKGVYFLLGDCYENGFDASDTDLELAKTYGEKAVALDSEYGQAYRLLSIIEFRRFNSKKAIELANKAINCKEPDLFAYYYRAKAYAAIDNYPQALVDVTTWLKVMNEENRRSQLKNSAWQLKGDLLRQMRRYDEAITAYHQVFPYYREKTEQNIIHCLESLGKFAEASKEATKLIEANPKDEMGFQIRAGLREKMRDTQGAISDYTKAIDLSPAPLYYRERARIYEQLGKKDLAIEDLKRAKADF